MAKKACKRRYPRIKPKVKKYFEGGTTGSFLDTETTTFNKKLEDYQKQSTNTANQLPSYLQSTQSPNLDSSIAPQYKSLAGNTKSNYGIDLSSYFSGNGGNKSTGSSTMDNMGTYSAIAGTAAQLTEGLDSNQYNQQYGYQGSAASSTASSAGPIGGAISGVLETVGNIAGSANDYNEYGYNEAGVAQGSGYQYMESVIDPFSQWQTDIEEEQWGSSALTAAGLAPMTGLKQYQDEQAAAKDLQEKEERKKTLAKIKTRNANQASKSVLETQPTMMYPEGGTVDNSDIVRTYGNIHNTFSKDTNMVAGKAVPYGKNMYVSNRPDSAGFMSALNDTNYSFDSNQAIGVSDKDTNGVLVRRAVPYTDKRTGKVYNIPAVDSDVFDQYFPNAKTTYATGGMVQEPNAELEKGEPFRTPDGAIHKISDNAPTHAEGGVQMNLPEGTQILGKLEMYNKDKKFKEAGTKLKQMYDKYNKQLTENTSTVNKGSAELMMNKVQNKFSQLVAEQEAKAQAKQAKKYAKGGVVPKYAWPDDSNDYSMTIPRIDMANDGGTGYIDSIPGSRRASTYEDPIYHTSLLGRGWDTIRNNKETIGAVAGTAAQLAPAAYNIYQGLFGKTDTMKYSDYANPYRQAILSSIKNRKYNVEPELAANELAYQTGKRNIKQIAPSAGNLLSNYNALAGTRMRADGEALARKQNMENQYGGERAQILAQLGAQEASTKLSVAQYNKAAKAAKQGALSTGLDQLAGTAANMQIGKNLQKNDTMRFSAFETAMRDVGIDINTKEGKATLKYIMDNASK